MINATAPVDAYWLPIIGIGLAYGLIVSLVTVCVVKRRWRGKVQLDDQLVRSNPVGIIKGTVNGAVLFCNDAYCRITGYPAEDFISGRIGWSDITPQEWLPIDAKAIAEAQLVGTCKPYQKEYIRPDGTRVPVVVGYSLFGRNREQSAAFIIDLSEIHAAAGKTEANDRSYRAFFELTSVGIAQVDADTGRFICVNNAFCQMLGYTETELLTKTTFELSHPQEIKRNRELLNEARDNPAVHINLEKRYRRKDGSYFWAQLTANMVRDATGKATHTMGAIVDISERVRLQQVLEQTNQKKDAFLAVLAHELRNPLAPIRTALDILRDDNPQSKVAHRMHEMMERQVGHLVHLIDDLLDMSRVTQGKITLRKGRVSARTIIKEAVETVQPLLKETGHAVEIAVPTEDVVIHGDETRLVQVVSNLVSNAAKYTPIAGKISVTVVRAADRCVITVRDTGIGIPDAALGSIFEMFTQGNHSVGLAGGGLGIGLFLVKQLVELHGGKVWATSAGPDRGSTFTVQLPLALPERAERVDKPARVESVPLRRRILVVDDNRDAADCLAMLLQCEGHTIACAYTGTQALKVSETFHPDTVLLDIGLPDTDGYTVAEKLRQSELGSELALVAITGWGSEEDKARARQAGFDAHLTKPVEVQVIATLLNQLDSYSYH